VPAAENFGEELRAPAEIRRDFPAQVKPKPALPSLVETIMRIIAVGTIS